MDSEMTLVFQSLYEKASSYVKKDFSPHTFKHVTPLGNSSKSPWVRRLPKVCSQRTGMPETFCHRRRLVCQQITGLCSSLPLIGWHADPCD